MRRVTVSEVRHFQPEAERYPGHEAVSEPCQCCHIIQHGLSEFRRIRRKKVRAMHRGARLHKRVISFKLSSKIDSFLEVGLARCQLTADGKVSAPGSTSARHAYLQLCPKILPEEISAKLLQPPLKIFIHPHVRQCKRTPIR